MHCLSFCLIIATSFIHVRSRDLGEKALGAGTSSPAWSVEFLIAENNEEGSGGGNFRRVVIGDQKRLAFFTYDLNQNGTLITCLIKKNTSPGTGNGSSLPNSRSWREFYHHQRRPQIGGGFRSRISKLIQNLTPAEFEGQLVQCQNSPTNLNSKTNENNMAGMIFPGTKWCGRGNVAENEDDLGELTDLDKCCREHDHCPIFVDAGETKYDFDNTNLIATLFSCECETKFQKCVSGTDFPVVASIYFVYTGFQCIDVKNNVAEIRRLNFANTLSGILSDNLP